MCSPSSSFVTTLLLIAATLTTTALVEAMPTFVQRIPNGASVPGVRAVGHVNPNGGGENNAFGEAFEAEGTRWTPAVCQADSDGDGATNGEELGDPCCMWQQGAMASRSTPVTHPGVANAFSASELAALRCAASTPADNNGSTTVHDAATLSPQQAADPVTASSTPSATPSGIAAPMATTSLKTTAPTTSATESPSREHRQPSPTSGAETVAHCDKLLVLVIAVAMPTVDLLH